MIFVIVNSFKVHSQIKKNSGINGMFSGLLGWP